MSLIGLYKLENNLNATGVGSNGTNNGLTFDDIDKPFPASDEPNGYSAVVNPGISNAFIPSLNTVGPSTQMSIVMWVKALSASPSARAAALALKNAAGDFTVCLGVPFGTSGDVLGIDVGKSYIFTQNASGPVLSSFPSDWICIGARLNGNSYAISAMSDTSPIQVTSTGHGRITGDAIRITDAGGKADVGLSTYSITVIDEDNFTMDGTTSTGDDYAGGGSFIAGYADFFQDGILQSTTRYATLTLESSNNGNDWTIGSEPDLTASNNFAYYGNFKVDSIRFYSGLLTDEEFSTLATTYEGGTNTYDEIGEGGINVSGSGAVNSNYNTTGLGGINVSGSGAVNSNYNTTGLGGINVSGSGVVISIHNIIANGGCLCQGASVLDSPTIYPSGGVVVGRLKSKIKIAKNPCRSLGRPESQIKWIPVYPEPSIYKKIRRLPDEPAYVAAVTVCENK